MGAHPEEVYVCPRGFDGDYTVHVQRDWIDAKNPPVRLKLETIAHEGTAGEQKTVTILDPEKLDKPIVVHLSGGRRKTVLPYIDPRAEKVEIQAQDKPRGKNARRARIPGATRAAQAPKARAVPRDAVKP